MAAPALIRKALVGNQTMLLLTPDDATLRRYDDYLWRYDTESFLPHGTVYDPQPEAQPLLIGTDPALPPANGAKRVLTVEGAPLPFGVEYDLVCILFDSENQEVLAHMRQQWKELKQRTDITLAYWKQETTGGWTQQNI